MARSSRGPSPALRALAVMLGAAAWLAPAGLAARQGAPLADLHRRLVELIQGDEVPVAASPALCAARGLEGPWNPRDVRSWYFRSGACMLRFPTDVRGVVTRATQGLEEDLRAPAKVEALRRALSEIRVHLDQASQQERLMLHSTAWELGHAVDRALRPTSGGALQGLLCETLALLRASSYSPEEARALPSTLEQIPEIAGVEEIADLAARIAARDPSVVELLPPPEAHARLLHGRFTLRVFFAGPTPETSEAVRGYLEETPYGALGRLPLEVPDVRAVLVLYFNVLDPELSIVPTEQVAFWQQYSFDGQLSLQPDEFEQAEERIRFLSVRYQRNYQDDRPVYVSLRENQMSRSGFVDGMPSEMAAPVTTLRGACIRCHRRVVSSFHPEEERQVRFTRPLAVSGRELLTEAYTQGTERRLREWADRCR